MFAKFLPFVIFVSGGAQPESFADEAADIKSLMEGVRVQTEGKPSANNTQAKTLAKAPVTVSSSPSKMATSAVVNEKNLDRMLLNHAEEISSNVQHIRETGRPKASLGQNKMVVSETEEQRAARFFLLNGMKKMGHLLGDELTVEQEKAVMDEQTAATEKLHAQTPAFAPGVKAASTDPSADDLEDEEDADLKKKWAKVDALKKKRHSFLEN
eukprot:gnl/MRDRNA2_/MRDRNA2_89838_c0_seq1.p1 gnl/MRDRNA2_/MRDRNA2_89838_c0~~gnl/MRDRNA2_/MRDRNA2_89838_c0_seq1.p1  ORF type:complete len:212 (-),score=65.17 gnl/MRDRNA2_/MRDRNA2_89838_c0_seq1:47-682(-)